ncbi:MAG: hypothetical protein KDB01_07290 [Planctomycetaceae bacterium]|nr:hypothetical protein [Planctomycetaceae bacterium]
MAIEFNCPYCTATIRVPDAYSGKQGRCPKCDNRLLIPTVSIPDPAGGGGSSLPQRSSASTSKSGASAATGLPETGDRTAADAIPADAIVVRTATSASSRAHRRNARLRPSRTLVIGIPVICFLVLFGIIAYSLLGSLPRLHGQLTGHRLDGEALPGATIPWADVNVSPADRLTLQQSLAAQPESLVSQILVCRISADERGIFVTLHAQPESQWVAVDVSSDKSLAIWRRKEGPQWNQMRLAELRTAVQRYARDKLLKVKGEQIAIDPAATRDKMALNAGCSALGYVIRAVADAALYPCAAEDEFGTLYFCLPKAVQSFSIQGRTLANGMSGFNGEYTVTISSEVTAATPDLPVDPLPTDTEVHSEPQSEPRVEPENPTTSEATPVPSDTNSKLKD